MSKSLFSFWMVSLMVSLGGCMRIWIEPSCPASLPVGESGPVKANEQNPGAVPTYRWEVFPAEAGTFENPTDADTTFQSQSEGEAILQLTASDGLFQVVAQCRTTIEPAVTVPPADTGTDGSRPPRPGRR